MSSNPENNPKPKNPAPPSTITSKEPNPTGATDSAGAPVAQKSKADERRERREKQVWNSKIFCLFLIRFEFNLWKKEAQRAKKEASKQSNAPAGAKAKPQQPVKSEPETTAKNKVEKPVQKPVPATEPAPTQAPKTTPSDGARKEKDGLIFETAPDVIKLSRKKQSEDSNDTNKSKLFHHFDQYKRDYSIVDKFPIDNPSVHKAFIKLGLQSAHDKINGSNSRCIAFLNAFREFINDYRAPQKKTKKLFLKILNQNWK